MTIFKLLNNDCFDEYLISVIEQKIYEYLSKFKFLYPTFKLKPKHHFLVHYGRCIRNFGPPNQYSTIRFEAKHSFFKRVNEANHNHRNLCYSLAKRHQNLQTYYLMAPYYFNDYELGTIQKLDNDYVELVKLDLNCTDLTFHKWIIYDDIKYVIGDVIVLRLENDMPVFAQIKSCIWKDSTPFFNLLNLKL